MLKLLNLVLSLFFSKLKMDVISPLYLDTVIHASASTYKPEELERRGLKIALNLSNQKIRRVGNPNNPVYPEIIVWRPDDIQANSGQAIIVEAIEISQTIDSNIEKWRILASLGATFNLVVPSEQLTRVQKILSEYQITNVNLQIYTFDRQTGGYIFKTLR